MSGEEPWPESWLEFFATCGIPVDDVVVVAPCHRYEHGARYYKADDENNPCVGENSPHESANPDDIRENADDEHEREKTT